jgi:hypothetical protein
VRSGENSTIWAKTALVRKKGKKLCDSAPIWAPRCGTVGHCKHAITCKRIGLYVTPATHQRAVGHHEQHRGNSC